MEIKYEAVFGDQALFDGAPEDAVSVRYGKSEYIFDSEEIKATTGQLRDVPVVAMRRIIPAPKRWTMGDQEAGRLPDVGCRVNFCHKLNTNWRTGEIKYIDDQVAVIKADAIDRPFVYEVDRVEFKPIETTEEKARRERDEWAKKASQFIDDELDCVNLVGEHVMRRFYSAMLSGELPVPVKDAKKK